MPHLLERKIAAVRRRVQLLLLVYAACGFAAAVLGVLLLLGLLDWLIRYQDHGVRAICTLAALGVALWAAYRFIIASMRADLSDMRIAQRIERRFPQLRDRLSSTIDFLRQPEDDPRAGSAALRREVINATTDQIEQLRLGESVRYRSVLGVVAMAALLVGAAAALVWLDASSVSIAMERLVNPWNEVAWPQQNHLKLVNPPSRLAAGQKFELQVIDATGAVLPDDIRLHVQYGHDGLGQSATVKPMTRVDDRTATAYQDDVTRPFLYRVEGGDHVAMPWRRLEVVEPPAVEELALTLHFPAYTGWEPRESDPHLRALVGTQVGLLGKTTKPLKEAVVWTQTGPQATATLADDGYGFTVPPGDDGLTITQSGAYWFRLVDSEGFAGNDVRYDIRAVEDRAPSVALEVPGSDIFVTADAEVPIEVLVKDDLAIRQIELRYLRSDRSQEGEQVIELYTGPEKVPPTPADQPLPLDSGDSRPAEYRWQLAALELPPRTQITLYAAASDYQPQVGQSQPRRLTIITPEELQDRLAQRQSFILSELSRVLKLQQESRSQVAGLEIQLEQVGQLTKDDLDHLQAAELTQRQVDRGLTSPTEGVRAQIASLLEDLDNNNVESDDVQRRMNDLLSGIDRLGRDHLPPISRELTSALKGAQSQLQDEAPGAASEQQQPENNQQPGSDQSAAQPVGNSLTAAGEHQDEVIGALEQMLEGLSQWDNFRRFQRDIAQLRRDQDELAAETAEVGRETLTRDPEDLTSQQQANLERLAQRQFEMARQFERVQQQMQQSADELQQSDPLAADTIADALHEAQQQALGGQMRETGRSLQQNQVGQAAGQQKQISQQLDELLDILTNRRETELARLVRKLREAEAELQAIRQEQQGLRKKMEEAAKNPDEEERRRELERLTREQRELQEKTERLARELQRLQAEDASRAASRGSSKMGGAGEQGQQGNAGGAAEQAEQAESDLDEAQQQLAQRRRQAEMDLAAEQLARMEDTLASMRQRQQQLINETKHYDELAEEHGRLTRSQLISVRDLSRQQRGLQQETEVQSENLGSAGAFELALGGAAREMGRAADMLSRQETGAATQAAEQSALRRLDQLLSALKPEKDDAANGEQQQQQQGGEGGEQSGQQEGPVHSLAELRLILLMQEEVNTRTKELEQQIRESKTLTPEQQREYNSLSEEQGRLADLMLDLAEPAADAESPEELPELKLDDEAGALPQLDLESLLELPGEEKSP